MVLSLWDRLAALQVIGYLAMTRSFAYLGVAPLKIFIGELVLGSFLISHCREIINLWTRATLHGSPLSGFCISLLLFVLYGVVELARGIALEHPPFIAFQNFVFNLYPLYCFLGLWVGWSNPWILGRIAAGLAWFNGIYGLAYVLALHRSTLVIPGSDKVALFGQPSGSAIAILGMLCFGRLGMGCWIPLVLNSMVMVGVQVRAEWLGFLVGLCLWGLATRNIVKLLGGFAAISALLAVGFVTDVKIPGPETRGGDVSARALVGRILAPVDKEMAREYNPDANGLAGTVSWRKKWWSAIWDAVHQEHITTLLGMGYGYPLSYLVPYIRESRVRSPHNFFYYALGYSGWMGVFLFGLLQSQLGLLAWQALRTTGQAFGIVLWGYCLSSAFFSNSFETPFGAIPFYLLISLVVGASSALTTHSQARSVYAQPAPVATY